MRCHRHARPAQNHPGLYSIPKASGHAAASHPYHGANFFRIFYEQSRVFNQQSGKTLNRSGYGGSINGETNPFHTPKNSAMALVALFEPLMTETPRGSSAV